MTPNKREFNSNPRASSDLSKAMKSRLTRRRFLAAGLTTAAIGSLLSACGGSSPLSGPSESTAPGTSATPVPDASGTSSQTAADRSGRIVVGLSQEPTSFNPIMPGIEVDQGVHWNILDTLWRVNEKGEFLPNLAMEVPSTANGGISEDGTTWTIKLRDDVQWHDGQPFTADDVKFTLELINDPSFKAKSTLGHELLENIIATSPTEITWKMKKAFVPYLAVLASTFIVPKHILGAVDDPNTAPFNNEPVGTGAFKWSSRVPGDYLSIVANPGYHGIGPFVEEIVFKYIPDLTVMFTQFQTGAIDYTGIQGITPDHYEEALTLKDRTIYVGPGSATGNIAVNLGRPQFQEKAVREALYYAMDKDTIINKLNYGVPVPTESYLPHESWAWNPELPKHEYNPEKAREILDAAGWVPGPDGIREKNGVRLAFSNSTTAGNQVREQMQALLQQNWREIGVELEITNMPAAVVWGEYWTQSQYDSVLQTTPFMLGPDPDCTTFFSGNSIPIKGGSGLNSWQYENPKVDALLEEGLVTFDHDKRAAIYREIQQHMREDLPMFPIFQSMTIEGVKNGLEGYVGNPSVQSNCWNMNEWKWTS